VAPESYLPRSYLLGVLADGARPFRFRPGMHELLGLPDEMGVRVTFASMPQGRRFIYLRPQGAGEQYAVEDNSQWWVQEEDPEAAASEPVYVPQPAARDEYPVWIPDGARPEMAPPEPQVFPILLPGTEATDALPGKDIATVPPDKPRPVDNSAARNSGQPFLSDPTDSMDSGGRRPPGLAEGPRTGHSPNAQPGQEGRERPAPGRPGRAVDNSSAGDADQAADNSSARNADRPVDNSCAWNTDRPFLSDPIDSMDSGGRRLPGTGPRGAGLESAADTPAGLNPATLPARTANSQPRMVPSNIPAVRPEPGPVVEITSPMASKTQPDGRFKTPAKWTATTLVGTAPEAPPVPKPGPPPREHRTPPMSEPERPVQESPPVEVVVRAVAPPPEVPAFWERRHLRLTRTRLLR
jgi:hypothetical protein